MLGCSCDRCGRIFTQRAIEEDVFDNGEWTYIALSANVRRHKKIYRSGAEYVQSVTRRQKRIDLCEDCRKAFIRWIEEEKC